MTIVLGRPTRLLLLSEISFTKPWAVNSLMSAEIVDRLSPVRVDSSDLVMERW